MTCCHTFWATGITTYLRNGGTIKHARQIAVHESPRSTKLYDRTGDAISLDEIERILIQDRFIGYNPGRMQRRDRRSESQTGFSTV